jgi:hypothetical protein
MPIHHFMRDDLLRSLLAVCLFPLFVVLPGYSLAWLLDLCEFRRRTWAFRAALSLCLSMAVCPVVTYLAERFGSARLVWALHGTAWLYFAVVVGRGWRTVRRIRFSRQDAVVAAIVLVWVAVALFSLVDLQTGDKDYYSVTALDFAIRTAFTHSVAAGIPPHSPFYFPGRPQPGRYHYFWMILCAMVERTGGGLVGPRHAWIGGAAWGGIGLMALVALSLRIPFYRGAASFRRRATVGILLLGVTGLDIVPASCGWVLHALGMERAVVPSIDWWNEQVCGFLSTALWEAHYVGSLIGCMTAFLLLWEGARQTAWRARVRYGLVAGLALASALGTGIYVVLVFAVFLTAWTLVAAARKWWPEAAVCAIAGCSAAICAAPYLASLRGPSAPPGPGGSAGGVPFEFQVRQFAPMMVVLESARITRGWPVSAANMAALPLNYFLEFGLFFSAGGLWWRRRPRPLSREQLAAALMLASSLLICTFVRSFPNNDLGWRGMLVAQLVLLFWAVEVVTGAAGPLSAQARRPLAVLALLGAAGSVYDVAILRFFPLLADGGVVATIGWMSPDRDLGRRNYAQREAYEWLDRNSAPDARIQFNPDVTIEDVPVYLYSERQVVAADHDCRALLGGDPALCPPIQAVLARLYPKPGQAAPEAIADACGSLPADVLVAKDTDDVWRDRRSWVWQEKPMFANRYVRLFGCRAAARP